MPAKQAPRPMVDLWYQTCNGDRFEVVATDDQDDAIEIQYLDGAVEELDEDTWESLNPQVIDPPHEALAGAYGDEDGEGDADELGDAGNLGWPGAFDEYE